jgi:hypothetical protein
MAQPDPPNFDLGQGALREPRSIECVPIDVERLEPDPRSLGTGAEFEFSKADGQ